MKELGVNSIRFVKEYDVRKVLGKDICMGCVTGRYKV